MNTVIIMKGLPGSGKSTYAKQLVALNPDLYKRINRDDLRGMFDGGHFSESNEKFVRKVRDMLILKALEEGKSVIVDDTNLSESNLTRISQLVNDFNRQNNTKVKVEVKIMDTPLEACIERDSKREKPVGEKVIKEMHGQFFKKHPEYRCQDESLPGAIICDLDGTLALITGRNPFDASKCDKDLVNSPVAATVKNYAKLGYKIILLSGRPDTAEEKTREWLAVNKIPFDQLFMRRKGDSRKDSIVKKEIFEKQIAPFYNVEFALDDRNQVVDMWRNELYIPCYQVFYGDF
jgi:predicted kinase